MKTPIGRIFKVPGINLLSIGYKICPPGREYKNVNTNWHKTRTRLKPDQFVLVIDTNKEFFPSDTYYRVISLEGTVWVYIYDLIEVDEKTGTFVFHDNI